MLIFSLPIFEKRKPKTTPHHSGHNFVSTQPRRLTSIQPFDPFHISIYFIFKYRPTISLLSTIWSPSFTVYFITCIPILIWFIANAYTSSLEEWVGKTVLLTHMLSHSIFMGTSPQSSTLLQCLTGW